MSPGMAACALALLTATSAGARAQEDAPEREAARARIVALEHHPGTDVRTALLSNGVRVHHRKLGDDEVLVTLHVHAGGGGAREMVLAEIAAEAIEHEARGVGGGAGEGSGVIRELVEEHGLKVFARGEGGGLTVSVRAPAGGGEAALRTLLAIMRELRIEEEHLIAWREERAEDVSRSAPWGGHARLRLLGEVLGPDRFPSAPEAQAAGVAPGEADQWVRSLFDRAPMEGSIVGEIGWERAFGLCERILGDLPARARMVTVRYERPALPAEAVRLSARAPMHQDRSLVVVGFHSPGWGELKDLRAAFVAGRVIERRLRLLADAHAGVKAEGSSVWPGRGSGDSGAVLVEAKSTPESAEATAERIESMLWTLAKVGPGEEETHEAVAWIISRLDDAWSETRFWGPRLAELGRLGLGVRDLTGMREGYGAITPADVRRVIADHGTGPSRFRLIVSPEASSRR